MIKKLRDEYEKLTGKKVFNGWKEEQLEEKIKAYQDAQLPTTEASDDGTELPEPDINDLTDSPAGTPESMHDHPSLKTDKDLFPPLPEGLKTDKEVIAEAIEKKEETLYVTSYSKEEKERVLNTLYASLRDGAYRKQIISIQKEKLSKKEFINRLEHLKNIVKEGELKAIVNNFITLF